MRRIELLLLPARLVPLDAALLVARLVTGIFLVYGVWDNIASPERMAEFEHSLAANRFPLPELAAPVSVWTQFAAGLMLIAGLAVRWAGLLVAATFLVGWTMVHLDQSMREQWPALALLLLGLVFAALGGGAVSLDRRINPRA